jgi:predicted ATPase/DNA-binding XRE family transcriptional regulator
MVMPVNKKPSEDISFGEWLRQRRHILDLTQQELADQVGCARITLRRIEAGALKPSKELASILLEILGAPKAEREAWLQFARGLSGVPESAADFVVSKPITNLPTLLTSFIGREKEQQEIVSLLDKYHLVTLIGPGGVGKTRLSIQAAQGVLESFSDGVWLVELAPVLDPLLVPRTTAIAIGLRDEPQRPVIDMLCDYLRTKKMLIILDNCEHLVDACARLAEKILQAAPDVRILASSREALGIAGEAIYRVPSLGVPDIENLPPVAVLGQYEAVELFTDRATVAVPAFKLTNENASALAQICHRLDGIPLAIELAAAKIRVLSIDQLAKRLDDRFRLLTGGSRMALERHQTLRASIDWSYNLLSPAEQILFRRLSIFVGGWILEAAESVCGDESASTVVRSDDVLNLMEQLINKSLINTEELQNETRYRMLETIRQFANDKLVESGESDPLRDRHLSYFLNLAETAAPYLIRPEQLEWLARLDADYDNLRAALEWALSKEPAEPSLRLCAALGRYWYLRAFWLEGSEWLRRALSKADFALTAREKVALVKALCEDAELSDQLGDLQRMKSSAEQSFILAQEVSDEKDVAIARFELANVLFRQGNSENVLSILEQSYDEFQALNDPYWQSRVYQWLIEILDSEGKITFSEKVKRMETCLNLARHAGERLNLAELLNEYSERLFSQNRLEEAINCAKEADHLYKQISPNLNLTSFTFAELAWLRDDYKEAERYYLEMKDRYTLIGEKSRRSHIIQRLGQLALEQGDLDQAQAYFEEALATAREVSGNIFIASRLGVLGITYYLQGKSDLCRQCWQEAIPMLKGLKEISRVARYILLLTVINIDIPDLKIGARLLGAVNFSQHERPITPLMMLNYNRAATRAREKLGDAAFELAFAEGQKMSLYEALDLALKIVKEI